MKAVINKRFRDKFKGHKRKILYLGLTLYSFSLIGATTIFIKGGFIGKIVIPVLKTNVFVPINYIKSQFVQSSLISLDIKHKNLLKIKNTRDNAKEKGYLISKSSDWVSGIGTYGDKKLKYQIRLKGLLSDHWDYGDDLWSYKLKIKGDKTLFGMKSFALQHPRVRNYMDEWYFLKMSSYSGLIAPRFIFSPLSINGKRYPTYSIEELFGKRLIENNKKREGPIFMISDKKIFNETFIQYPTISFYQENYYLKKPEGKKLLRRTQRLLNSYYADELKASEVFDINLFAKAFALADLFGHDHSVLSQNMRFYMNPVTGLIEPIPFDNEYILRLKDSGMMGEHYKHNVFNKEQIVENPVFYSIGNGLDSLYAVNRRLINKLFLDPQFSKEYIKSLESISKKDWLDDFFISTEKEAQRNLSILHKSYPWYEFRKKGILYKNQNYIKSKLYPESSLLAFEEGSINNNGIFNVKIANKHSLPIEVLGISDRSGKVIKKPIKNNFLSNRPNLCIEYDNCLSKKLASLEYETFSFDINSLNFDLIKESGLTVVSRIIGTSKTTIDNVFFNQDIVRDKSIDLINTDYLDIDEQNKTIQFKSGEWQINKNLTIPKGYIFKINSGTIVDLVENSSIRSYSPIMFLGLKDSPVQIISSDKTGEGLLVSQVNSVSNMKNVIFRGLKSLNKEGIHIPGSVTFYESDVNIENVNFLNNYSEDALNIIRSKVRIEKSNFENIYSDAVDFDFCTVEANNLVFLNIGNDGIDVSGTKGDLKNINIVNVGDKGISVGERSEVEINNININKSFIGLASKDDSFVEGKKLRISKSYIGLASYQKKSEYGPSQLYLNDIDLSETDSNYLSENNSRIIIDSKLQKNNINDFYRNIYLNN